MKSVQIYRELNQKENLDTRKLKIKTKENLDIWAVNITAAFCSFVFKMKIGSIKIANIVFILNFIDYYGYKKKDKNKITSA
jgi:hypothetical protein